MHPDTTPAGPANPGIHIDFPADGQVVRGGQLVAYGTVDENLRVSGTLSVPTAGGQVERPAEQVYGPPESAHWVLAFTDLPAAEGPARLEVTTTGGGSEVREGLRIEE